MPNEQDKNMVPTNKQMQLPIDLAPTSKVIVKPANDNSKMSIQPTFRTIQHPQMRVVRMPSGSTGAHIIQTQIMPQTVLKPAIPGRSTITVSKSPAAAYLPRVAGSLGTIQGAKAQQQIRTPTPPSSIAGISPAMLRTSIQPRTSSPNTVISQGTTAWVSGSGAMQVQVPQIIRSTITQNRTLAANIFGQTGQQNSTISVSTSASGSSGQPTYVATVLPQRPSGATIVYTSQQPQPLFQGQVQRMGIATATTNARQIRPLRQISTTGIRVNSSTLSIRQNVPGLTPTTILSTQPRNTSGLPASTAISNPIPARIYQVQSQQTANGSPGIGQPNQKILQANVMLPIIVNNSRNAHLVQKPVQQGLIAHVSKLTSGTVSSDGTIISSSITNTMPSISNTMVASIQPNQSQPSQVSNQQGTIYTTQSTQQVANLSNQGGGQIFTVTQQQQQLISNQSNIHQTGNLQTVVPLAIGSRNTNIPIKTITVSASNSGSLDSAVTVHRNTTSNAGNLQATTIMPITKIVSQQHVVNSQHNLSGAQVSAQPVYIHTRIPTVSVASTAHSHVISASASNSTPTFSSSTSTAIYYDQASLSSAANNENKQTPLGSSHENSYTVASTGNVQRYNEKMIHSFIASNFQNSQGNNTHIQQTTSSNQQSVPIRFSPLVVESQAVQQTPQQVIAMGTTNIVQQHQATSSEAATHMIMPVSNQIPTSPRGNIRKQNETPTKGSKKQPKAKNYQMAEGLQMRVPQRQPLAAGIAQLTQTLKPLEQKQLHSTASSPKTTFSERESPSHIDEWSDGSTTVSIPNSPRSEEDDLDAMILSNQFNKMSEEFAKFASKSPSKSSTKREADNHGGSGSPRTKKIKHERAMDITDSAADHNSENNAESANSKKKDVVLKKPQASLLQTYNQNWKQAHNHFLRYSDVKVREERKLSVMDLANLPRVSQRVNGWKTHLISAEITEMIEGETAEMDKLNNVLKRLETSDSPVEIMKISELAKGSMQRSRLVIDSLNDSNTQLLKIFDHKDHAADIINRCASKRNFKKR